MKFKLEEDFVTICKKILEEDLTEEEWDEISSSDMFQEGNYIGGYEGADSSFTFSYYSREKEYWFQMSLNDISEVAAGKLVEVDMEIAV